MSTTTRFEALRRAHTPVTNGHDCDVRGCPWPCLWVAAQDVRALTRAQLVDRVDAGTLTSAALRAECDRRDTRSAARYNLPRVAAMAAVLAALPVAAAARAAPWWAVLLVALPALLALYHAAWWAVKGWRAR